MSQFVFEPVRLNGEPVRVRMSMPVRFSMGKAKDAAQDLPPESALPQNLPNPFNPSTTIKYDLAEPAFVELKIYSVTGQVVRTLVAEQQAAGRYQVVWDGKDDQGRLVASGVYTYRLKAGAFEDARKLMLMK